MPLWWSGDRSWFVHIEIDATATLIGASRPRIDAILAAPGLDAVEVRSEDPVGV